MQKYDLNRNFLLLVSEVRFRVNNSLKEAMIFFLPLFCWYLYFQTQGIFGGDSGDLAAAASVWGIPHPPGYPLYTFLGAVLIRFLAFFTPAWRLSLLSSFFSALSVVFWFLTFRKTAKNFFLSLVGSLTIALGSVYWLYSEVPEVFGLNNFFISIIVYLSLSFFQKPAKRLFYLIIFFTSLSLTHHHTIIFIFPAIFYLIYQKKGFLKKFKLKEIIIFLALFVLGLLPFIYLPLAGMARPLIDWGYPVNPGNFFRLISRSIYGSFQSSPGSPQEGILRLVQLPSYFLFMMENLTIFGLLLLVLGVFWLNKKDKILFRFFGLAFVMSGPFFVFYASFPLLGAFALATYERFLLLSLPFAVAFAVFGMKAITEKLKVFFPLVSACFFVLPAYLLLSNYPYMARLRQDFSADNLGRDILKTTEPDSILILAFDQPLFNSQYVHFSLGERPDIKLIHLSLFVFDFYRHELKANYPDLYFPDKEFGKEYVQEFLEENAEKFPIYSNVDIVEGGWREPIGLLTKYHQSEESLPSNEELLEKNEKVWISYQDLFFLTENKDYFLMPLSIVNTYREKRSALGEVYLNAGLYVPALKQFQEAMFLDKQPQDLILAAAALHELGDCQQSEDYLKEALESDFSDEENERAYNLLAQNAKDCWQDVQKEKNYLDKIEEIKLKGEKEKYKLDE